MIPVITYKSETVLLGRGNGLKRFDHSCGEEVLGEPVRTVPGNLGRNLSLYIRTEL